MLASCILVHQVELFFEKIYTDLLCLTREFTYRRKSIEVNGFHHEMLLF